jgi:hypothetical protein
MSALTVCREPTAAPEGGSMQRFSVSQSVQLVLGTIEVI